MRGKILLQVHSEWREKGPALTATRMADFECDGVQCVAAQRPRGVAPTVERIADAGVTNRGKVNPDLMRPAGFRSHPEEAHVRPSPKHR